MRGSHIRLGEGERKVRLGQDSLPNKAETSGDYIRCFTRTPRLSIIFEEGQERVTIRDLNLVGSCFI